MKKDSNQKSSFRTLKENIERGKKGANNGLKIDLPKINKELCGIQRGIYYLIGGKTSSGKTTLADSAFIMSAFKDFLEKKNRGEHIEFSCLYFSLEINIELKMANFAASSLYSNFGIISTPNEILSKGEHVISKEQEDAVDKLESFYNDIDKHFHFFDALSTPKQIISRINKFVEENGTLTSNGDGSHVYTPHHSNHYVLIVVDTINLLEPDDGKTLKQAIDSLSKSFIEYRNVCLYTPVIIQQLNADIDDPRRIAQKMFLPTTNDLEDSKRPSKDAEVVLLLFDPLELEVNVFKKFELKNFTGQARYRHLRICKNRYGTRYAAVNTVLYGAIMKFKELEKSGDMMTDSDWRQINNL